MHTDKGRLLTSIAKNVYCTTEFIHLHTPRHVKCLCSHVHMYVCGCTLIDCSLKEITPADQVSYVSCTGKLIPRVVPAGAKDKNGSSSLYRLFSELALSMCWAF